MSSIRQNMPDLSDLKGRDTAWRVLEIAAAAGHHLLIVCRLVLVNPFWFDGLPVCYRR